MPSGIVFTFREQFATQKVFSFCVQSLLLANTLSTAIARMVAIENIDRIVMTCASILVSFALISYAFSYSF